jgi:FkbM family methyltransferase
MGSRSPPDIGFTTLWNAPDVQALIKAKAKGAAKRLAGAFGFELRRVHNSSQQVAVGDFRSVMAHLRALGFDPGLVFDVGAFRGEVAAVLHEIFDRPVVMVEPLAEMGWALERLARDPDISWERVAAGSVMGTSTIYVDERTLDGTSMAERKGPGRQIDVVTLDSLVARHGMPGLVKLDVQGHELSVLQGSTRLLGVTEVFVIEALFVPHHGLTEFAELVSVMAAHGYVVFDFAGFARRPMDGALGQADVVFVREDSALRQPGWY